MEAAETELREASLALIQARAGSSFPGAESQEIDIDLERIESGKAAAISGAVGTLATIPVALTMVGDNGRLVETALSLAGVLVSCFLFGLTYRYIVRRDLGNTNLKAGAVAAFGLVRGEKICQKSSTLFLCIKCCSKCGGRVGIERLSEMEREGSLISIWRPLPAQTMHFERIDIWCLSADLLSLQELRFWTLLCLCEGHHFRQFLKFYKLP